jgi:MraZ protein
VVLRGNYAAKIDDKGRFKIPTAFRVLIEEKYGSSLFMTSYSRESVRIYPMPVWVGIEKKLAQVPSTHPSKKRFSNQVNYYGQSTEFDKQGRVLVHGRLRELAHMVGEVDVFGQYDYLEIWNHERFLERFEADPFTDDDALALSEFGI